MESGDPGFRSTVARYLRPGGNIFGFSIYCPPRCFQRRLFLEWVTTDEANGWLAAGIGKSIERSLYVVTRNTFPNVPFEAWFCWRWRNARVFCPHNS